VTPIPNHSKAGFAQRPITDAVLCGDALKLIPTLPDRSVNLALFSPPYGMQRNRQYGGVAEKEYPAWMCRVMAAIRPKLAEDASILVVIRPHIRDGVVSDYVLRTRLALREDGWMENEELIWHKPDAPFLGSQRRLRRNFENILWFSNTNNPYINVTATGNFSERIGFTGSFRFRNQNNPFATKRPTKLEIGQARGSDVFVAFVRDVEEGIMHPAMFPASLCEKLIRTFSREGDLVCDPFCGSGTTLVAAQGVGRKFIGFDLNPKYIEMAKSRLNRCPSGSSASGAASGSGFRLHPDFPQTPKQRRAFLMSKGLNGSDVRVFNLIVERTVDTRNRLASVALSLSDIAELTGFSRRTIIRSLDRLREESLIQTERDEEPHRHRSSLIGIARNLLLPVVGARTGDTAAQPVTSVRRTAGQIKISR